MKAQIVINVDLARPGSLPRIYAVQGEKDTREILFFLFMSSAEWDEADGAAANVRFRRADSTGGDFAAGAVEGNKLKVVLNEAVCAKAGPVTLLVELSLDGAVIATWPMTVQVASNPGYQPIAENPDAGEVHTDCVKTVNGVAPDGLGNVDVQEGREEPVHVDMAGFYDGTIRLEYEDGGIMAVAVTFDADGNPIRFSNGVEEITFTWPSEEAAADG